MGLDYYAILDVKRNATISDVKLAYRKLALRLHPLRGQYQQHPNPMPEGCFDLPLPTLDQNAYWEFVNEAYDVLSNELWRQMFDQYGEEGLKRGVVAPSGFIPAYIYHKDCLRTYFEFFGSYSPYCDLIDAATKPPPLYRVKEGVGVVHQDPDIIKFIHLSLEDVYNGGMKHFTYSRKVFTDQWKQQLKEQKMSLSVPIPRGCMEGTRIVYPEHGDQSFTRKSADLVFVTCEELHPIFRRVGSNLHMKHSIKLRQALAGFKLSLMTLDGRTLELFITDIVNCSYAKHLKNEGLPSIYNQNNRGDLIIHFNIEFPAYIPKTLRTKIDKVFEEIEEYREANEKKTCVKECD